MDFLGGSTCDRDVLCLNRILGVCDGAAGEVKCNDAKGTMLLKAEGASTCATVALALNNVVREISGPGELAESC